MITEFVISGVGLYLFRKGQKVLPKVVEALERMKRWDLEGINLSWYEVMHNLNMTNNQGKTFDTVKISSIKDTEEAYTILVRIPSGKTFDDLNSHRGAIENNYGGVCIMKESQDKKYVAVDIYTKVKAIGEFIPIKTDPYKIFLGYDYANKPVFMDMSKYFNLIISGVVGSGKSRLLYIKLTNLIYNFDETQIELYLFQTEKSDLNIFNNCKQVKMFARTLAETSSLLDKLCKIIDHRNNIFLNAGVLEINEYNEKFKNKQLSRIFVVGEECSFLVEEDGDTEAEKKMKAQVNKLIARILKTGRYVGINVDMVTQRATAEMIKPTLKAQMCRCTGRQMSTTNSNNVIESNEAVGLDNGEFILFTNDYVRFRTPIITKETVMEYIKDSLIPAAAPKAKVNDSCRPIIVETNYGLPMGNHKLEDLDPEVFKAIIEKRNKNKPAPVIPVAPIELKEVAAGELRSNVIELKENKAPRARSKKKNVIKVDEVL